MTIDGRSRSRVRRPLSATRARATPDSTSNRTSRRSSTTSPTSAPRTATSSASTGSTSTTSGRTRRSSSTRSRSVAAYLAAKSRRDSARLQRRCRRSRAISASTWPRTSFSAFVQDDWQIAPKVKMLYGVRYDLYKYPAGLADAPLATDAGVQHRQEQLRAASWAWRGRWTTKTVVRASTGIMYDQPILGGYEQALPVERIAARRRRTRSTARPLARPPFPNGARRHAQSAQSPWAVDPAFVVAHTWQTNVQVERAFAQRLTASVGFMYARGSDLPVVTDVEPDQSDWHARRRPADIQHARSMRRRVSTRASTTSREVQSIGDSTLQGR